MAAITGFRDAGIVRLTRVHTGAIRIMTATRTAGTIMKATGIATITGTIIGIMMTTTTTMIATATNQDRVR